MLQVHIHPFVFFGNLLEGKWIAETDNRVLGVFECYGKTCKQITRSPMPLKRNGRAKIRKAILACAKRGFASQKTTIQIGVLE